MFISSRYVNCLPENYKLLLEILKDVGYTINFGKDDYNFLDTSIIHKIQSSTNFLSLIDKQPFFGQIQTRRQG